MYGIYRSKNLLLKITGFIPKTGVECRIERKCGTKAIGLDWGVSHYFSTIAQDGNFNQVENPRYLRNSKEQLASLLRDLALAKKGTRTHRKLKHQIAKLHQKIARQRLDFTHKETAKLVEVAALIAT